MAQSGSSRPKKSRISERVASNRRTTLTQQMSESPVAGGSTQNTQFDLGIERLSHKQQSAVHAKKIKLQDLISEFEDLRTYVDTNCVSDSLVKVGDVIKKMNTVDAKNAALEIWDPVNCTMESHVLHLAHEMFTTAVDRVSAGQFSDSGYIAAISAMGRTDSSPGSMDWTIIEENACVIAKTTRFTQSMYGTFDIDKKHEQPEKIQREKGRRRTDAIKTMAKKIVQQDTDEERTMRTREIHSQIEEIYEKNHNQPIPYFPLILDPTSFMYTVDNAFQLSLLLRDNLIVMDMGSRSNNDVPTPTVRPATAYERFTVSKQREAESIIISISPRQYRELITFHKIKAPLLNPKRTNPVVISDKLKALSISNLPQNIHSDVTPIEDDRISDADEDESE